MNTANNFHTLHSTTDCASLRCAIRMIDTTSQGGLQVVADSARDGLRLIAELGLGTQEQGSQIASILEAISFAAEDVANLVNVEAEKVGCNWVKPYPTMGASLCPCPGRWS